MSRQQSPPYWRGIVRDIQNRIESGEWPPDHRLPSTAELAEMYGTSKTTVRQAITVLTEAGTLKGHQGLGVFVAQPKDETSR